MSGQTCLGCGTYGPVELHHLAGRNNVADLVVPVCTPCHLILTNWQYAAGIELHVDAERTDLDVRRAVCVGVLHLLQLMDQRSTNPISDPAGGLIQITGRAMSRILDLAAAPERASRWLPDSTIEPHVAAPVAIAAVSKAEQTAELLYLIGALLRLLGDVPPVTTAQWDAALADTRSLPARFLDLDLSDHAGPDMAALISQHLDAAHHVMVLLLTVEDWSCVDERDLDEARIWFETGNIILQRIASAVTANPGGDAA